MNIEDFISNDLITFEPTDSVGSSKLKADNQIVSHFPIIQNNKLFGSIAESDLSILEQNEKPISDFQYIYELFYATEEDSLIDLLTLFANHETNILPVLNEEKEYIGYLELSDILTIFSETPFLKEEGIVLVIEKSNNTFSISEVTQIAESNNATILGLHISNKTEENTQITIKIKSDIINEIIQSYRRYEYNILSNHQDDSYLEELKNRSNYLQKYLSI